ncbi:MAG: hypothetical protein V4611_02835 [Patescibacteria group bacterium]
MDQNRFDTLQSTFVVVSELRMAPAQRRSRGEQFTVSLIVFNDGVEMYPLDIYVDRLQDGDDATVFVSKVNKSRVLATTATIQPDGERFNIEILVEKSKDLNGVRPSVLVPPEMFRQLQELHDRQFEQGIAETPPDEPDAH